MVTSHATWLLGNQPPGYLVTSHSNIKHLQLLDEDGFGDENNFEEKKKSQRGKKTGGGGGGRYRGGNTMMKCAVLDEVVKQTRAEEEVTINYC